MKSARQSGRRGGAHRRGGGADEPSPSKAGTVVLVLGCLAMAAAAFWITQRFLAPSRPVLVTSNTVTLPGASVASVPPASNPAPANVNVLSLAAPAVDPGTPPPIDTNDPVQLVNRGTAYLDRGMLDQAIEHYRLALAINPQDEEAHFNLGYAHAKKGDAGKAIEHYNEALELFADYGEAHNNLGNIYVQLKRYDEAMKHFGEAIRINPENSSAFNNRGRCLAAQNKIEDALADFQKAVQLHTNYVEARFNVGMSFLQLGRPNDAIRQFEVLRQMAPDFQPAVIGLEKATNLASQLKPKPAPETPRLP